MSEPQRREDRFRIAVRKYPPFEQAIAAQWVAFERDAQTGLVLDLVALDLHPLEEALFDAGAMANGAWDVVFVNTDWISALAARGCAVNLAPRFETDPPKDYPAGWTDSLLRLQRVDDAVLGVPYHDGPECLIYRRDLFEDPVLSAQYVARFGKPLAPPRTWAEFHQQARYFHDPSRGIYGTAFAAYPDGHNSVYDFLLQLWSRGGELVSPAGQLCFTSPEAEAALDFYRAILHDTGAVHTDCATLDSVAAGLRFAAGEIALMINWFGFATMAHTSPESLVHGMVDVAPVPADKAEGHISLNVYWLLAIAVGSPHRETAWRFLKHTLSPAMDKLTTLSGGIGCRRSTWADAEVNRAIPFYHRLEELHRGAREIPQRRDWPAIARTIDTLVMRTLTTDQPVRELLAEAQHAHHTQAVSAG